MAVVYLIKNLINNKVYVGKTEKSIKERWLRHVNDSRKQWLDRPLYNDFRKYGLDAFVLEVIEECDDEFGDERERYWIEKYDSFNNGYNLTLGGPGKSVCDYDLVLALYKQGYGVKAIARKTGYDHSTINRILELFGINSEMRIQHGKEVLQKSVVQIDAITCEVIREFPSLQEACAFLGKQSSGHIPDVCNGKRKTAYGYKWAYKSNK